MYVVVLPRDLAACRTYLIDVDDIAVVAQRLGRGEDTVKMYDNHGYLVAMAIWEQGSNHYDYYQSRLHLEYYGDGDEVADYVL